MEKYYSNCLTSVRTASEKPSGWANLNQITQYLPRSGILTQLIITDQLIHGNFVSHNSNNVLPSPKAFTLELGVDLSGSWSEQLVL